jgi:hypothetical protein
VTYYPKVDDPDKITDNTDNGSDKTTATIYGVTKSNRTFLASGLQPLTNYTFEVLAFNGDGYGPAASATFQTSVPESTTY